ncbi:hypothetical protein, partial [Blautia segnis]|uniref:hypothetical protein n=1 Tax=Blautia segnis TaxID=2763030 RepID=UPI0038CBF7F2
HISEIYAFNPKTFKSRRFRNKRVQVSWERSTYYDGTTSWQWSTGGAEYPSGCKKEVQGYHFSNAFFG